jgi:excisionase family DNA binding protein
MQPQITAPSGPYAWLLSRGQRHAQPAQAYNPLAPMLTTTEAAAYLKICPTTVRRWLKEGRIRAARFQATRRGRWRIPLSEVQRLAAVPKDQK